MCVCEREREKEKEREIEAGREDGGEGNEEEDVVIGGVCVYDVRCDGFKGCDAAGT